MMQREELPSDVVRFIEEHIDTVPHLETLLLLWENPSKDWSAEEIARRTYVSPQEAARIVDDLVRHRLIAAAEAPAHYRYEAAWDPAEELMGRVAATYRRQLIQVASLIHSKASSAVRDFARAFRFKKE